MGNILVVDDLAIFRDLIASALRQAGYHALSAASAKEAAALIKESRPDLILLDIAMPGTDGLAFMEQLRGSSSTAQIPIILITASVDKQCILRASKMHAQGYLLKSAFSLDDLLDRVGKFAASPALRPSSSPLPPSLAARAPTPAIQPAAVKSLARETALHRVTDTIPARTLGGVVSAVIAAAGSPRTDLSELTTLISRDLSLSARVLQTANSAAYARSRGGVTSIQDAVRVIGSGTVRNIALSLGIFDAMPRNSPDGFNPILCWQHSFAVARLCDHLLRLTGEVNTGVAYMVGLCHDLGELTFRERFGPEYRAVMECHDRTNRPLPEIEKEILGLTHGELVQIILNQFGFPPAIKDPIAQFHRPPGYSDAPLVRILRMADTYANALMLAAGASAQIAPFAKAYCRHAVELENPTVPNALEFRGEIVAMTSLLVQFNAKEQQLLLESPYPGSNSRIWLARNAALSDFDPVHAFLGLVAQLTAHNRLPDAQECAEIDGLIVMANSTSVSGLSESDIAKLMETLSPRKMPLMWLVGALGEGRIVPAGFPSPMVWPVGLAYIAGFVAGARKQAAVQSVKQVA